MRLRVAGILAALAVVGFVPGPVAAGGQPAAHVVPAVAVLPVLTDGIAPGVNRGLTGFGVSSVIVPTGTYVTYLVRTDPNLAGRTLQVWVKNGSSAWARVTTRVVAANGSVHYFARIRATTKFRATWAGDEAYAAASAPGRTAGVSASGETRLMVSCDEFAAAQSATTGRAVIVREAWIRAGATVTFRLCTNASTGFDWGRVAYDPTALRLRRHWTTPPPVAIPGAPGIDNWTFGVLRPVTRTVSTAYGQPWTGGEKAVWTFRLTIHGLP